MYTLYTFWDQETKMESKLQFLQNDKTQILTNHSLREALQAGKQRNPKCVSCTSHKPSLGRRISYSRKDFNREKMSTLACLSSPLSLSPLHNFTLPLRLHALIGSKAKISSASFFTSQVLPHVLTILITSVQMLRTVLMELRFIQCHVA